jgi:hypothetical protein
MTREAGKGSKQRPTNHEAYSTAWDTIFGAKQTSQATQDAPPVEAVMPEPPTQTVNPTALPVSG